MPNTVDLTDIIFSPAVTHVLRQVAHETADRRATWHDLANAMLAPTAQSLPHAELKADASIVAILSRARMIAGEEQSRQLGLRHLRAAFRLVIGLDVDRLGFARYLAHRDLGPVPSVRSGPLVPLHQATFA